MNKDSGIKWLFLDLNSYFASVEQQENPALRGKPVAVVPADTDYTCAIAASYEAKAYGIKTGTMIGEAKKMCPNLHCVVAQHRPYVEYHNRIIEEVGKHIPINKICSIDELSSRLPPSKRNIESAQIIATKIKTGIQQNIGSHIKCSIGVAPNSLLAKIACDMKKPDGLTFISQEDLPGPLLGLNLTDIPGIGFNMHKRLNKSGIYTMKDLWNTDPKHARKIWNNVQGERLWYWLHGYDFEPPETKPSMIGHSRVLDPEKRDYNSAQHMARQLLLKAVYRLHNHTLIAQHLYFSAHIKNVGRWNKGINIYATDNIFFLLEQLDDIWNMMRLDLHKNCSNITMLKFKKISISLHGLTHKEDSTKDLFLHNINDSSCKKALREQNLFAAMKKLQNKYKSDVVTLGLPPKTNSGDIGTKIAFSRVPDIEEFWSE
ncbi:MAG: impB/mucB/samB family protein [Alphaproteobacteria bacterium]|nr:impB/mucB/samB family protein [Alphaproteobacteria bacterium]